MDYTLHFPDQATADSILTDTEGNTLFPGYSIDVIGTIYKPTGNIIEDTPEMVPINGWHVNIRGPEEAAFEPYQVYPTSPVRVWF